MSLEISIQLEMLGQSEPTLQVCQTELLFGIDLYEEL